jgi:hypothetical protein
VNAAYLQPPFIIIRGEDPAVEIEKQLVGGSHPTSDWRVDGPRNEIARRNELGGHNNYLSNLSAIVKSEWLRERGGAIPLCSRLMRAPYTRVTTT